MMTRMENAILKCVFVLCVFGLPEIAANIAPRSFPDCCKSFKDELERKSQASKVLCSENNDTFVPLQSLENGSSCCESLKTELKERWDAYNKLCPFKEKEIKEICPKSMILKRSVNDYAISKGAPVMKAITACFWVNTKQKTGTAFYISYAVSDLLSNHFFVYGQTDLKLYMTAGTDGTGASSSSHNIKINDGLWHHICVTWQSINGHYSFYRDGKKVGSGSISSSIGKPRIAKGTWVLGQDQGTVGGGFQASQSVEGELTGVNIWDKDLSAKKFLEISRNCKSGGASGNVKSWADFMSGVSGNVKIGKPTCC